MLNLCVFVFVVYAVAAILKMLFKKRSDRFGKER
jgi:hypothetical protein